MKLIVGLGNPGKEYEKTRHNMGFLLLETLRKKYNGIEWKLEKSMKCELSKSITHGETVLFAKPTTYMNLSGEAVVLLKNFYKIATEDILVIFDDVDLPTGSLRYRAKGSAGTHNGMRSIVTQLGDDNFPRIKIGIKPEHPIKDLSSYVLGRLTEDELASMRSLEEEVERLVEVFLTEK